MSGARDSDLLRRVEELERQHRDLSGKVSDLDNLKYMGKGALRMLVLIGSGVSFLIAAIWAVIAEN